MFPTKYKAAVVKPLLKKSGFDSASPANYRTSSNVKFWIICLKHAYNHISSPPLISVSSSRSIGPFTQRKLPCCTRLTIFTDHLTKADRPSSFLLTTVLLLIWQNISYYSIDCILVLASLAPLFPGFARTSNVDLSVSVLASHRHDTGSISVACNKVLFWDHYSFHFIPHQSVSLFQILGFLSNSMLTTPSCIFQFPLTTWMFTSTL